MPNQGCGHHPKGCPQPFRPQFRGFDGKTAKRGHVDILFPINNREGKCPQFWGGPWEGDFRGDQTKTHTSEEREGREGKVREEKGRAGKGREGKGGEGTGRKKKRRERKEREGKGREGKGLLDPPLGFHWSVGLVR